ncbi:uncharacterized protein LOC144619140 [Crassostrea virginica]
MYARIRTCVKSSGCISQFFENNVGLLQGEVLSPLFFTLYVNDLENEFTKRGNTPTELQLLSLYLLMYADDMVLFSESISELQNMLNTLQNYTTEWSLDVNVQKTKVVVFRNGGKIHNNEKWSYSGENVEIVDQFVYLGIMFNLNGKFFVTQKQLAAQGRKAMFALKSTMKQLYLNHCTLLSLFDTYVCTILNYGCEVWGSHRGPDIEKVHLEFLRYVLGVRKNTNTSMVYFETGRLPLYFTRIFRMFKFWFKMMQSENCILRASYECLYHLCENSKKYCSSWVSFIKEQLYCLGLGYIWNDQNCINSHVCLPIIRQRLKDHFIQNLQSKIQCEAKCYMYKYLVDNFCLQFYLEKSIPKLYKKCITKIRVSSHNLCIESGRHKNIPRDKRFCKTCTSTIEDEYHFILVCPVYKELRSKFLKKYYWGKPSMFKLIRLLSVNNVKELCNLGKYIFRALSLRTNSNM